VGSNAGSSSTNTRPHVRQPRSPAGSHPPHCLLIRLPFTLSFADRGMSTVHAEVRRVVMQTQKRHLYAGILPSRSRREPSFSSHRIRPVICMTTNNVRIAPIVTANPVNPSKKNAYENKTR
jgi:hypothetical protein